MPLLHGTIVCVGPAWTNELRCKRQGSACTTGNMVKWMFLQAGIGGHCRLVGTSCAHQFWVFQQLHSSVCGNVCGRELCASQFSCAFWTCSFISTQNPWPKWNTCQTPPRQIRRVVLWASSCYSVPPCSMRRVWVNVLHYISWHTRNEQLP